MFRVASGGTGTSPPLAEVNEGARGQQERRAVLPTLSSQLRRPSAAVSPAHRPEVRRSSSTSARISPLIAGRRQYARPRCRIEQNSSQTQAKAVERAPPGMLTSGDRRPRGMARKLAPAAVAHGGAGIWISIMRAGKPIAHDGDVTSPVTPGVRYHAPPRQCFRRRVDARLRERRAAPGSGCPAIGRGSPALRFIGGHRRRCSPLYRRHDDGERSTEVGGAVTSGRSRRSSCQTIPRSSVNTIGGHRVAWSAGPPEVIASSGGADAPGVCSTKWFVGVHRRR